MNNRNCKPKVSLRMADGGVWGAVKGVFSSAPQETMTQKFARQDAERAAKAAKAAPAVSTPAAAPAGAGIGGYAADAALKDREARAMRAAGLRDGGEVPGSGRGDKIPALYEPGEFVVSNAMLKKAPGLRDQLHELREETLAGQGKTVAQADAQAYDDGSEGEQDERIPERFERRVGGTGAGARVADHDDQGGGARGGRRLRDLGQITLRANQGFGFSEDFLKSASDAIGERFNPTPPPNGRYGAPPNPPLNSAVQSAAPATPQGPRPTLRAGVGSQSGAAQKALYAGGRTAAGLTKLAGALGPAAVGADVVSHFNDYKINDPEVDSSNSGTFKALANGDFSGAGRSFSKGALEAGMDLGSFGANMLDYVVRGKAPVSTAYDGMLRRQFGDQLQADPGVSAQADAARTMTAQPSLRTPTPTSAPAYTGPMGPQINPDAPSLRGRPGADVAGAPGVSKFTENGRTLYSNVAGDNADMMDKKLVGIVPGMPQAQIDRILTNPDGSRWSAADNAVMAANLRDGIDPYRGTSRQKGEDEAAQIKGMRELAFSKQGTPGRLGAMKMFSEQQNQQTLRQGQDLKYKGDTYNADMTAATAQLKARADTLRDERDFGLRKESHDQTVGTKARENAASEFSVVGADGKPDLGASKQAFDAVRQIFPGIDSADEATRNKFMSDAKEMHAIFQKARSQDPVGWDALKFWEAKRPALNAMPNAKGGTTEQVGALGGLVTLNAGNGDTLLKQQDGTALNLGQLNSRQRELLERAKTQGWGK